MPKYLSPSPALMMNCIFESLRSGIFLSLFHKLISVHLKTNLLLPLSFWQSINRLIMLQRLFLTEKRNFLFLTHSFLPMKKLWQACGVTTTIFWPIVGIPLFMNFRRDGRVVECAGLLNRWRTNRSSTGSNPVLSAIFKLNFDFQTTAFY